MTIGTDSYEGGNPLMEQVLNTTTILVEHVGVPDMADKSFAAATALLAVSIYSLTNLFDRMGKTNIYNFSNVISEFDRVAMNTKPDFELIYWHQEEKDRVQEITNMMDAGYVQQRRYAATALALMERKKWLFGRGLHDNKLDSSSMQFVSMALDFVLSCMKVNVDDMCMKQLLGSLIGTHLITVAHIPHWLHETYGSQKPRMI